MEVIIDGVRYVPEETEDTIEVGDFVRVIAANQYVFMIGSVGKVVGVYCPGSFCVELPGHGNSPYQGSGEYCCDSHDWGIQANHLELIQ